MAELGIYGSPVPDEEIDRLKTFDYPAAISIHTLDGIESLHDKVLLDAGSGSNKALAQYAIKRGALYIPVDLNMKMIRELSSQRDHRIPFRGVVGDVRDLPLSPKCIDVSHQRFVLMHLSPEDQEAALRELCRVTRGCLCLLEYDWSAFTSEDETVLRFIEASMDFMHRMDVDPYMGRKLESLVKEALPDGKTKVRRFGRKSGDYTSEIIGLARSEASISRDILGDINLSEEFEKTIATLKASPAYFIPPDIVAVTCDVS